MCDLILISFFFWHIHYMQFVLVRTTFFFYLLSLVIQFPWWNLQSAFPCAASFRWFYNTVVVTIVFLQQIKDTISINHRDSLGIHQGTFMNIVAMVILMGLRNNHGNKRIPVKTNLDKKRRERGLITVNLLHCTTFFFVWVIFFLFFAALNLG